MAKKTNPTPDKTAKKKPVTMAERVKRIELDVNRHGAAMHSALSSMDEFLREATDKRVLAIDRRTMEQGKVLDSICRSLALDMGDRLKAHTDMLHKLQSELSLLRSGASFMKELEKAPVTIPEQGLEKGDYTDASKEVADALTAMGLKWGDGDRTECEYIVWDDVYNMILNSTCHDENKLPQAEFLARAAVTAKKLGLVAKEEPEPVQQMDVKYIRLRPSEIQSGSDRVRWAEGLIRQLPDGHNGRDSWLLNYAGDKHAKDIVVMKATPEEVAKYHADKEAAKPIVFGTPIEHIGRGKGIWMGMDGILHELAFLRHGEGRQHQWSTLLCPRSAFTVID